MMKKIICYVLIGAFVFITISPLQVNAASKTLQDFKNEVAAIEKQQSENNRLTSQAKASINAKRNAIVKANETISTNENKVEASKTEVAESEEKIKIKTSEMKDVIKVLQYLGNNTDELYMDYVFDASSVSELMERQYVVEQIINNTQKELDALSKLIDDNKALQQQLATDNQNLASSITKYEQQLEELEKYIDSLATIGMDYKEKISALKEEITKYEKAGCKNSDSIDDCYYNKQTGSGYFSRPLVSGTITQKWGNNGHKGMDIGGNKAGTYVYAPADGTVAKVSLKNSCGGNIIYAHYTVNGVAYTTEMAHLKKVYVKTGQKFKKGDVIATVGGDSSTWYYDHCTTGTHLHYAVAYGYYLGGGSNGYSSWSKFQTNTKATNVQKITGIKNQKGWKWKTRG